jgi:hypothetical protein
MRAMYRQEGGARTRRAAILREVADLDIAWQRGETI